MCWETYISLFSFPNSVSHPAKQIKYLKALGAFVILVLVFVHFHVIPNMELIWGRPHSPLKCCRMFEDLPLSLSHTTETKRPPTPKCVITILYRNAVSVKMYVFEMWAKWISLISTCNLFKIASDFCLFNSPPSER